MVEDPDSTEPGEAEQPEDPAGDHGKNGHSGDENGHPKGEGKGTGRDPKTGRLLPGHTFSRGPRKPPAHRARFLEGLSAADIDEAREILMRLLREKNPNPVVLGLFLKHVVGTVTPAETMAAEAESESPEAFEEYL